MGETRDYTRLVPIRPPEGLLEWAEQNSEAMQKHILVYKIKWMPDGITYNKRKMVEGWCSACGQTSLYEHYGAASSSAPYGFMEDGPDGKWIFRKAGDETVCPCCGAKVKATHCGAFKSTAFLANCWPMTVGRVEDRLVLTGWNINREVWKHGGKYQTHTDVRAYEAYVIEEKKIVRLKAYEKVMTAIYFKGEWKQVQRGSDEWGTTPLYYPWDPALLNGSTAENSKLDRYLFPMGPHRAVTYLRTWLQHKNVENLVMQGAGPLLDDMYEHATYYSGYYGTKCSVGKLKDVNWKEKRPSKMLGLTAEELRWTVALGLNTYGLRMIRALKAAGQAPHSERELEELYTFGAEGARLMAEKGLPVLKIVRYIRKQCRKYPAEKDKLASSTLEDYWLMAKKAGDDLNDPKVRWPQHLLAAHDAVLLRQKFEGDPKYAEKFEAVYARLAPLSFEAEGLLIRPCRDHGELIREGKLLSHCVGTYAKSHAEGKHCIFFIRRAEAPEVPFYTLELSVGDRSVLQNRGKRNCARTKEVKAFEELWVSWLRSGAKRDKNGKPKIKQKAAPEAAAQTERKAG